MCPVSASMSVPDGDGRRSVTRTLGEGLGLPTENAAWVILRDGRSGLEWLRRCRDIHESGLDLELHAYECRVYLAPRVVWDGAGRGYARLAEVLAGAAHLVARDKDPDPGSAVDGDRSRNSPSELRVKGVFFVFS